MTIKDSAGKAGTYAKDKVSAATAATSETFASAKDKASETLATAKEKASEMVGSARVTATQARQRTADGIDASPVAALIGGLALGALAAAVLPRTRKEDEIFGEIGVRINDTARDAAQAAKEAGRGKLDELGINKDSAMDKAKELAQSVSGVVKESANAAASSVKSG